MKQFKNIPMANMEIVLVSYLPVHSLSVAAMEIILVSLCHLIFP